MRNPVRVVERITDAALRDAETPIEVRPYEAGRPLGSLLDQTVREVPEAVVHRENAAQLVEAPGGQKAEEEFEERVVQAQVGLTDEVSQPLTIALIRAVDRPEQFGDLCRTGALRGEKD